MHLLARDISKSFGTGHTVGPLSLSVRGGEALCLFGPSGAGKTTVLRMLAGLENPSTGNVSLDDDPITSGEPAKPGVFGMVFQEPALWPHMNTRKHLQFVLRPLKLGRETRRERIRDLLTTLDLNHTAAQYPHSLSGGERRRLSLARALVTEPRVLLLDEPFAQLDSARVDQALELVRRARDAGTVVVFTTHSEKERNLLASEVITLDRRKGSTA